jgi:hypothetical protein
MGAVWPFVTGFTALGHYRYQRPWAGYPLIEALSRQMFDFARGRHAELLSGRFYRPLDTAVPHQFFATSMLVSPIVSGLLGWEPDAPERRARLTPQLPPHWRRVVIRKLRVGDTAIDVTLEQELEGAAKTLPTAGRITWRATQSGPPIALEIAPATPAAAMDVRRTSQEVRWLGGLTVGPPPTRLTPAGTSEGLRILDVSWDGASGWIDVEGRPGFAYDLVLAGEAPKAASTGATVTRSDRPGVLHVALPESSTPSVRTRITLAR